jgi:polysaccharide export outer membrane protein
MARESADSKRPLGRHGWPANCTFAGDFGFMHCYRENKVRYLRPKTLLNALFLLMVGGNAFAPRVIAGETAVAPKAVQLPSVSASGAASANDYLIGAGDVLQIMVWKEPDASVPSAVVRPDGRIAMPLLKEVSVAGLTPRQAEQQITQRLGQIIHDVDVTVVVASINSRKAFVLGAVRKEGPVTLSYRMNLLQVLSEAGGVTEYAKKKKIYLLRNVEGKQVRFPFNYEAVLKGQNITENIEVLANDTVVVPQ